MYICLVGFALMCLAEKAWGGVVAKEGDISQLEHSLQLFKSFVKEYDRVYVDETEFEKRFEIFRDNLERIKRLQEMERGTARYGITKFSDLTPEEFKNHLGYERINGDLQEVAVPDMEDIPEKQDWREHGIVTPVKNQRLCGSCWAFSVVGNVESQHALKKGKLISLSEQQLLDCDHADGGCNGGMFTSAFNYITTAGGLESEADYPYEAVEKNCRLDKSKVKVTISGWKGFPKNETLVAQWLQKNGPLTAGLNANTLQHYMSGIVHPKPELCSPENLDHGILVVGFGVEKADGNVNNPYWIIKNSWGTDWGEKGYFRMYRGDGTCGIDQCFITATIG